MSRIFITGVDGIVGTVLKRGLEAAHDVSGVDLPVDLTSAPALAERLYGVQTVIHLARERNDPEASANTARVNPRNIQIDINVFASVIEAKVERVVFASSVHADDFRGEGASPPFAVPGSYHPVTPYGTYKLIGEEVGGGLARRFGFEFVAIRLGGVTKDNSVKDGPGRAATWLSHRDLLGAVSASISPGPVRGRSTVFYAVSSNATRVHDTSNPFGWTPRDDSSSLERDACVVKADPTNAPSS